MFRKEKYHVKRLLLLVALILFTIIAICSVSRISKLCDEIEEGNNEKAISLAEKTYDLNKTSTSVPHLVAFMEGEVTTPLVKACETGNAEMILWLLDHGARTDYSPVNMLYPLEAFCGSGSGAGIDALKALLDHGADPDQYKNRPSVFRLAQTLCHVDNEQCWQAHVDMIILLIDSGAKWQDPTDGYTLLHYAAMQNNGKLLKILLDNENAAKYIDTRNNDGNTPLDIAVQNQNTECTDLLQEWWLNDDEKEFLIFNCVDEEATRDQIMKGTLPEWKHDLVYWHRKAMEHLTENYPNTKFTLTTYEYITSDLIKFYAIAENNDNMAFTVMVDQESGQVTDTYYE